MPAPGDGQTLEALLEAIAALPAEARDRLLARLAEIYPGAPAARRQAGLPLGGGQWSAPADYVVVFDGGSRGNPGAGYGSFAIYAGRGAGRVQRVEFDGQMTNNEAEYHTLLRALGALGKQLGPKARTASLEVRGDSQLIIQQIRGEWKAKDERMQALRDQARAALARFGRWRLVQQPREDSVRVLGH